MSKKIKVISFSLWGNLPKYNIGALRNAELALKFYPDYECWFYIHKETVPNDIINKLKIMKNTKLIMKEGDLLEDKPMCWRFESISNKDVEIMLCRDTDSRIFIREKLAVDEWLNSDCYLHIMRDHKIYHNSRIFGGMFGIKKYKNMPNWLEIMKNIKQKNKERMYDLKFLNKVISDIPKNKILAHTSSKKFNNEISKKFPIEYDKDFNFIGSYIDENEKRVEEHHDLLR